MIKIDLEQNLVSVQNGQETAIYALETPEAFAIISRAWLRSGWDNKYLYGFTWFGRPVIQLPEDLIRIQEVIYCVQPDVIIEIGVAHGGSLIFYASLCKVLGRGRVVGVDIEIRPHNRRAIEEHPLFPFITLIEGNSIEPATVERVYAQVRPNERTLILLDSCHRKEHVLAELKLYAPLVSLGSYIVAMDGIMEQIVGAQRTQPDWTWNNPKRAALKFVESNPEFVIKEPPFIFNEGMVSERVTYWVGGFVKRISRKSDD